MIENCPRSKDGEACTLVAYHRVPCTFDWAKSYADMKRRSGQMHSTDIDGWTVHHNGGYDGDAIFVKYKKGAKPGDKPAVEVEIPMKVILTVAARAVSSEKISKLEQQEPHEVLGLPKHLFK